MRCAQLRSTLCDPVDCSPPGSSVHGIFQARIQEWVAISFFRRSTQGSNPHLQCLLYWQADSTIEPPGKLSAVNKLLVYFAPQPQCACVCVLVHGVLCFLPKFFWISWIRTWTFGKAFQYQFSQYMSDLSMERPLVDLSMSHYLHVVQHLMSRSGISVSLFPCCFFAWLSWWGV